MTSLYQSRQVSWIMIGTVLVMGIFLAFILMNRTSEDPAWPAPVVLLLALPFSTMTVTVTREHVRIAFLPGLPRKTVPIGEIRTCEPYRAKGLQRFVTQIKPFRGEFVMGGTGGVVVVRHKGIPLTISDPEPEKLARAVVRAGAKPEQPPRT